MRKIKRFEVDSFDSLVYAVSLVDEPAIESGYKYFNNEKRMVQLADEEKHVVVGAVLIPDKEIYRYDESTGMEYFLVFSRKAVKDLSEKFLKDGFANNWTLDHQYGAEGVYTVESWIKEDMEKRALEVAKLVQIDGLHIRPEGLEAALSYIRTHAYLP